MAELATPLGEGGVYKVRSIGLMEGFFEICISKENLIFSKVSHYSVLVIDDFFIV